MKRVVVVAFVLIAGSALADTAHHGPHSAYAGLETRDIKALSSEQVDDLKAGRGMGLALAAELNGYPGPRHVLDLAHELGLTAAQHERTSALFDAMRQETGALGERLIDAERTLDRLFADRRATPDSVAAASRSAGMIEGELRAAHLRYHLAMMDVLTPQQIEAYNRLRGYAHH